MATQELKAYCSKAKSDFERIFSAKTGGEDLEETYAALQAAQKELNIRNSVIGYTLPPPRMTAYVRRKK